MSDVASEYLVTPDQNNRARSRFEEQMAYAEKADTHVWVALATFSISDARARVMAADPAESVMMDRENLQGIHVGCFRCEEELTTVTINRRCKGTI